MRWEGDNEGVCGDEIWGKKKKTGVKFGFFCICCYICAIINITKSQNTIILTAVEAPKSEFETAVFAVCK